MLEATSTGFNPEYIGILPRWFGRIVSSVTWQDNIVPNTFSDTEDKRLGISDTKLESLVGILEILVLFLTNNS